MEIENISTDANPINRILMEKTRFCWTSFLFP